MRRKTYIIIVTYNGRAWLKKCLDSCTGYPIIIVDNNSTDESASFIETHYPEINLIKQNENLGFGQANNLGISYALSQGAEHVFLLNQDAYIIDNSLDELILHQKSNPEYGVLSPIHITGAQEKLDKNFAEYMSYKNNTNFYSDFVLKRKLQKIYSVPFVNAAAWLLSKEVLLKVGGFDPLFFHYGEDNNFCQRVVFHKYKIGVIPDLFIIHDREHRKQKENDSFGEDLRLRELILKTTWANINVKELNKVNLYKRKLIKQMIRSGVKLKVKRVIFHIEELRLINQILPRIIESRTINSKSGSHYLTIQ